MPIFCIPKNLVKKLKESALRGEVDIAKLYEMSSSKRREFFTKYTDESLGKLINSEFEKAMISKNKNAITDWAKSVFSPTSRNKPVYKNIIDKINTLDDLGVLSSQGEKAFLEDLVSSKLGIDVGINEIKVIEEKAKMIDKAQKKIEGELGNPYKSKEILDFFIAKKAMDDYLEGLVPGSNLRVLTGTIGRGMMLASVKSPLLNVASNIELAFTESLSRRIAGGMLKGGDNQLALDYIKMINLVYKKTGYDLSRMRSLSDKGASGERVLGETVSSQGPGAVKAVGRVVEDIVFKWMMGAPDVAFGSAHFADSLNLNSLKLAKGNKSTAKEFMIDAMRLEPQTAEGEGLREQAILDAEKATWTNKSWASRTSEGIRKIFNDISGDLRAGDYLFPFIKTPANVIATGMDYAGMGIPKALWKSVQAFKSGKLGTREHFDNITRDLVRSGLGLTAAVIFASYIDDDDFVGAYDPSRAQIEALRNSNTHSFRLGGKWISTDWLGPVAVPFTAIMFARKHGETGGEKTFQYSKGVLEQAKNLPGIEDIYDIVRQNAYKDNQSLEEMTDEATNYLIKELATRLMPSFISDIAKATDPYNRLSTDGWEAFKAKIPGLRQTLPIKTTIFGEESKAEPAWSTILFGSRVKTDLETDVTKELINLMDETGKSVNFTNWETTNGKKLAQFKDTVGAEEYKKLSIQYGKMLNSKLQELIGNEEYQKLSVEDKLSGINNLDTKAITKIFEEYEFKYDPDKNESKYNSDEQPTGPELGYAYFVDQVNGLKILTTDEKLDFVEGNLVALQRDYGLEWTDVGGSQDDKKKMMEEAGIPWEDRKLWKREHIVPVGSGGGNDPENLILTNNEIHDSYTPIDSLMAVAIKKEKVTHSKIKELSYAYKIDKTMTPEEVVEELAEAMND